MSKVPTDVYQNQSTQISDTMHKTIKARYEYALSNKFDESIGKTVENYKNRKNMTFEDLIKDLGYTKELL